MYQVKQSIANEYEYCKGVLRKMKSELKGLPDGSLGLRNIKGKEYYYHQFLSAKKIMRVGISKLTEKNLRLIRDLKRKAFILKSICSIEKSLKAISLFQKDFHEFDPNEICNKLAIAYKDIAFPCEEIELSCIELMDWQNEEFEKSLLYPEDLRHFSAGGRQVRSKSETVIVNILEFYEIPYRYEAALRINGKTFYPDFTVLTPTERKIVYWEHFGLTSNEEYLEGMDKKLLIYRDAGIIPWNNLITTYDNEAGVIDTRTIQKIVDVFLLNGAITKN